MIDDHFNSVIIGDCAIKLLEYFSLWQPAILDIFFYTLFDDTFFHREKCRAEGLLY